MANIELRKTDIMQQYAKMSNTVARIVSDVEDLNEEEKKIREEIKSKMEKQLTRLRAISAEKKTLKEKQSEAVGGYKMAVGLLKKLNIEAPKTQLHRLAAKNETAAEVINV